MSPPSSSSRWIRSLRPEMIRWRPLFMPSIRRAAVKAYSWGNSFWIPALRTEQVGFSSHFRTHLRSNAVIRHVYQCSKAWRMRFLFPAVTNAAMDLSPVLLGVLFTLLLLCFVIFAKVYCFRAITTTNGNYSQNEEKHANNISYKKDEVGGLLLPSS